MTYPKHSAIALGNLGNCGPAKLRMQCAFDNPNALLKPRAVWLLGRDLSDTVNRLPHGHGDANGGFLVRDKAVRRRPLTNLVSGKC